MMSFIQMIRRKKGDILLTGSLCYLILDSLGYMQTKIIVFFVIYQSTRCDTVNIQLYITQAVRNIQVSVTGIT